MTKQTNTGQVDLFNSYAPVLPSKEQLQEVFGRIAEFQAKMRQEPDRKMVEKTPDGKADSLVISAVENELDEMFSGLWNASNFHWQQMTNEVVGCITLEVFHPECGIWLKRDGVASIQVMVNKGADALDITQKKPNALFMGFPKLKAECLKNAAKSFGDRFGRNLNRKKVDTDFEPMTDKDERSELIDAINQILPNADLKDSEKKAIEGLINHPDTKFTRIKGIYDSLKGGVK